MIKVVEAISDTNIGGAGILLINRLKYMRRDIFDVTVILPRGSMLIPRLKEIGVKVLEINCRGDRSIDISSIAKYFAAIKKVSPDIINCHGSLNSRIASKLVGVPIKMYTRHCVFLLSKVQKNKAVKCFTRYATNVLSDCVIAVSFSAKSNLVDMGIDRQKIKVIINGAEGLRKTSEEERRKLRHDLKIDEKETVVSICARLEEYKDHKCFLKAAKILSQCTDNKYKFIIIGTGSLENSLKRMAKALRISDIVIFTGFLHDVSPYMNITDINVNCSIGTETSSLALSEGMSLGIPAVVSDYGGNPYMVRDGENGYVYKAQNYKELARKITEMTKVENYSRLSRNSLKCFKEELNAQKMTENMQKLYLAMYQKVLTASRKGSQKTISAWKDFA